MTNHKDIDPASQNGDFTDDARHEAQRDAHRDAPPRHASASAAPTSPHESRRIPPSGDVSPDGKRIWPRPSLSAKILVWGGTGIAAAALTAGTILAARRIAEAVRHDEDEAPATRRRPQARHPVREQATSAAAHLTPRFAELGAEARDQMRARNRQRELEDALEAAHQRAEAAEEALRRARKSAGRRIRPKARNLMHEVEDNTRKIGQSAESTINSLGAALTGFRAVAGQAGSIISDFEGAAKLIRSLFAQGKEAAGEAAGRAREAAQNVAEGAKEKAQDLAGSASERAKDAAEEIDRRIHRL